MIHELCSRRFSRAAKDLDLSPRVWHPLNQPGPFHLLPGTDSTVECAVLAGREDWVSLSGVYFMQVTGLVSSV